MSHQSRGFRRHLVFAIFCSSLLMLGGGCTLFRNMGTGSHYDKPQAHTTNPASAKKRDMIVEVTTDATGAVVSVQFKRSSGSDPIDSYVADTIRNGWPSTPSKTTVAEVTYSTADGFSQPKMISSRPAP